MQNTPPGPLLRSPGPGWIVGPAFDLVFFFGAAGLSGALGGLMVARPTLAVPIFLAWLLLLDGPHLLSTWARTYLDPSEWKHRGPVLRRSLAWLLPGVVAWAVAMVIGRVVFDVFLVLVGLWSIHHAVRQSYGILALYGRHARSTPRERRIDSVFLYGASWGMYALFALGHPFNRQAMGLWPSSPLEQAAFATLATAIVASFIAYTIRIGARWTTGKTVLPALFVLLPTAGLWAFGFTAVGLREPVVPAPWNLEQAFIGLVVANGLIHSVQYLGLVFLVGTRRHRSAGSSIAATLGRRPVVAYGAFVAASFGYVALNIARGATPGVAWLPPNGSAEGLALAVYWGLFMHHYVIDQHIWRPHEDHRLRHELGIA
jgi:hypothetical protein